MTVHMAFLDAQGEQFQRGSPMCVFSSEEQYRAALQEAAASPSQSVAVGASAALDSSDSRSYHVQGPINQLTPTKLSSNAWP